MNNDELQKAIDDITKDNAASAAPVAPENEALANELAGAPTTGEGVKLAPTAPAEDFNVPAAPAPAVPETPGMPPVAPAVEAPLEAAPAPAAVEDEEAPLADSVTEAVEAATANVGAIETPAPAPAPEPAEEPAVAAPEIKASEPSGDLKEVAEAAMKELYPLLDKTQMSAEEKFDICMEVEDAGALSKALEYAKGFTDETAKANALVKIIEKTK